MKVLPLLALLALAHWVGASPMDDVKQLLEEGVTPEQRPELAAKINGILALEGRGEPGRSEQVEAARIAGHYQLMECLPILLQHATRIAPILGGVEPLETLYPCVGAIVAMGERGVPRLLLAIGKAKSDAAGDADAQLKFEVLSYALMRIDSQAKALRLWLLNEDGLWSAKGSPRDAGSVGEDRSGLPARGAVGGYGVC